MLKGPIISACSFELVPCTTDWLSPVFTRRVKPPNIITMTTATTNQKAATTKQEIATTKRKAATTKREAATKKEQTTERPKKAKLDDDDAKILLNSPATIDDLKRIIFTRSDGTLVMVSQCDCKGEIPPPLPTCNWHCHISSVYHIIRFHWLGTKSFIYQQNKFLKKTAIRD